MNSRIDNILFLFLFLILPEIAFSHEVDSIDRLIVSGVDAAQKQEYQKADSIFSLLPENHPSFYLFKVIAFQARMTEEHDFSASETMYGLCDSTIATAGRMKRNEVLSLFYKGYGYGAMASYEEKIKSWTSSFYHGLKGYNYLRDCLKKDSSFYDAYTGIGFYYYWKGRVTRFLNWIPFVNDDREKGLQYLEIATAKGRYFSHVARYSLIWAYYAEKNYEKSLELTEEFLKQYPRNTIFFRTKADLIFKMEKWNEAARTYEDLLLILSQKPTRNGLEEIQCHYKRAISLKLAGERDISIIEFEWVVKTEKSKWLSEKFKPEIKQSKEELEYLRKLTP
jgi:tetratricopeptide (TPR) repeat protein